MRDEYRERYFTPFVLPVTVIGLLLVIGISLSRVLLAVSEISAALVALLAAGYIMVMAFFVEARKRITPRALGVALAIGLIGLMASGSVASAVGMRDLHEEEEGGGGEESIASPGLPEGQVFVAQDTLYAEAPAEVPVGDVNLVLDNQGTTEHNVVIEELGDELIVEAQGGESGQGDVTLEAGEYTYYCNVPGHRAAGMEGTLTASADAESSGESGDSASESGSESGSESASEGGSEGGGSAATEPASGAAGAGTPSEG